MDYDDSYKSVKGLEILGIHVEEYHNEILNEVSKYLFRTSSGSEKKIFDLNLDYKYYYVDFLKLGIDLNEVDISWWKFDAILESIFIDEESTISKVIRFRTYKKPNKNAKQGELEEHKAREKLRLKYMLHDESTVDPNLSSLYNFISGKASQNGK